MSKNLFRQIFNITNSDLFFNNCILLKNKFEREPFASLEITDDGKEILHVGDETILRKGHIVEIDE